MELYNTRTRKRALLTPQSEGGAERPFTIYACGITPYDRPHLGHAATAIRCAVLRRYLSFLGHSVQFVQNITDIDDKIINRAKQWGEEPLAIAERFTEEYRQELSHFGIPLPDAEPRVSGHIGTIIRYIEKLLTLGHAYLSSNGDVYFDIASAERYGALSGHAPRELIGGTREPVRKEKRHSLDFALWKRSDDPVGTFPSPWGTGRPGWHTECCAMSNAILGETIDIHCGGLDLLFPHHENELVQAECHNGAPFARWWFHLGLILVDGMKMSKSLGNFVTIADARERWGVPLLVYGLLTVHYRSPINLRDELFEERINQVLDLYWFCEQVEKLIRDRTIEEDSGSAKEDRDGAPLVSQQPFNQNLREHFIGAMNKDLNTPQALVAIDEAVGAGSKLLLQPISYFDELCSLALELRTLGEILLLFPPQYSFARLFDEIMKLLSIRAEERGEHRPVLSLETLDMLLAERTSHRIHRRFAEADAIRERLKAAGIVCIDGSPREWRVAVNG